MILFTAMKKPWWIVWAGNTTYSPMLLSDTCVSISQHRFRGVDKGWRYCTLHCLQKDTPLLLGGGPVSLPVGMSTMTALLGFSLCQRVVTFLFGFSDSTSSSGVQFLPPASGLGGSSDVEVAALELFFLDPATLDFFLAILGLFLPRLRLVLLLTPTEEMTSKPSPSPLVSFSESFFLALAILGMMCWYESSIDCILSGLFRGCLIIWGVCE